MRATPILSLLSGGSPDNLWLLALLTTVGTFALTYVGYRTWTGVKRVAGNASGRVRGKRSKRVDDVPRIGGTPPNDPAPPSPPSGRPGGAAATSSDGAPRPKPRAEPRATPDEDWDTGFQTTPSPPPAADASPAPAANPQGQDVRLAGRRIHAPRERATGRPETPSAPLTAERATQQAPAWEEKKREMALTDWERTVEHVMSQESVLARSRGRLSKRRSLQSLLASIRDRDLLHERGQRIGSAIYAKGYTELADRLQSNRVCEEAHFRKSKGDVMEIRLIGTAMAREAPVIGTPVCFMEAGLLEGAIENLEGVAHEVREMKCVVKGDPFCEFRAKRTEEEPETSWIDDPSGLTGGDDE